MKLVHWSSLILTLTGAWSCGSDDSTVGDQTGGPGGGTLAGGTTSGTAGGTTSGTGSPGGTGTLAGTGGPGGTGSPGGTTGGTILPMEGTCERVTTSAGPVQPDIMIVLDRSGSMKPQVDSSLNCSKTDIATSILCAISGINCNNAPYAGTTVCGGMASFGLDRWTPAVNGLKNITSQFQDKVSFGLTTFPGQGQNGGGGNQCVAGSERVPVAINSAAQIASALDMTQPNGNTPTGPTLQAVRAQIEKKTTSPDATVPPQYVLLVTDGEPTCPGNGNQARSETIKALDDLLKGGVKTYVLGYDASVDANLANALTEFAKHGGTDKFYPVQDEKSLVEQFKAITGAVAACSYKLNTVPKNPDYVKVTVDMEQVYLGKGFTLQGSNVILDGAACDKLRDGNTHLVDVSVECEPQIPIL